MKMNILLFIIYFFLIPLAAQSQWLNITNTNEVNSIIQDGDFIWVRARGGIVKFNIWDRTKEYINKSNSGLPGLINSQRNDLL
jgi:hypothetical protein